MKNAKERMKEGGPIKNQYKGKKPPEIWGSWDTKQRNHFLLDHNLTTEYWNHDWVHLPENVQQEIVGHVISGQYKDGGSMKGLVEGDNVYVIELEQPFKNWYGTLIERGEKFSKVEKENGKIIKVRNSEIQKGDSMATGGKITDMLNTKYSFKELFKTM